MAISKITNSGIDVPVDFNRTSTDGDIAIFQKDGSTVGSIGAWSSSLLMGTGDVGLAFVDGTPERIQPRKADDQTSADGLIDLGHTNNRFKDLYLSGGVYLGGTGSANYLDDYEEGTWTPVISEVSRTTSVTYQPWSSASYTKVGNTVFAVIELGISSHDGTTSTTLWKFTGFPFAPNSARGGFSIYNNNSGSLIGGGRFDSGSYNAIGYFALPSSNTLYTTFVYQTS